MSTLSVQVQCEGVHRLDISVDDTLLADDELAAHQQLTAHLAFDLNRIGDLEFAFHFRSVATDREEGGRRSDGRYGLRPLPILTADHSIAGAPPQHSRAWCTARLRE